MYRCVHGEDGEVDLSLAQPLITAPMKITFTAPEKNAQSKIRSFPTENPSRVGNPTI
jgi:hypothetical protein